MKWLKLSLKMLIIKKVTLLGCMTSSLDTRDFSSSMPSYRQSYPQHYYTFLSVIKFLESSNGKNIKHKKMLSGIHKGHSAIGVYGLMPNTIKELSKGKLLSEEAVALLLTDKLFNKCKRKDYKLDDIHLCMAAGWFWGHNLKSDVLYSLFYTDYISKYKSVSSRYDKHLVLND